MIKKQKTVSVETESIKEKISLDNTTKNMLS